ncbi:MAG: hypothetical protein QXQ91_04205 [Nanopusillaceae archaeon]
MGVISWNSIIPVIPEFISNELRSFIRLPKKRKVRLMAGITGVWSSVIAAITSCYYWCPQICGKRG